MWRSPALDEAEVFARREWSPRALVHAGWAERHDHPPHRRLAMDLRSRERRALRDATMQDWCARWAERGDGPTRRCAPDSLAWYNAQGLLHRTGAPALIIPGLKLVFYHHGVPHRTGGPALIHASGRREWYVNGVRHRSDGPARIDRTGDQEWWDKGVLHRADGPAVIRADGQCEWHLTGVRHRMGAPAVTHRPGHGHDQWWVRGRRTTPLDDAFLELDVLALPLADSLFAGAS